MKMNKTSYQRAGLLVGILLLLAGNVLAFGVSGLYTPEHPMYVYPGESQEFKMVLQNRGGAVDDVSVKMEMIQGSEVLEVMGSSDMFSVPAGGETELNMKVTVPPRAQVNDVYSVNLRFTVLATGEPGTLAFTSSVGRQFNVIVAQKEILVTEEESAEFQPLLFVTLVAIAALVGVVVFFMKKMKAKKDKRK